MSAYIDAIQDCLDFKGCHGKQFDKDGMGKIGTTGFVLGIIGGIHYGIAFILVVLSSEIVYTPWIWAMLFWSLYVALLCTFHFLEFFSTAVYQPSNLSYQSFIVNHSTNYTIAALASWTEFWLEYLLFGRFKLQVWLAVIGVIVVLAGQALRTVAMWQCGEHFSHIIMDEKTEVHRLVTTGVYKVFRHPSYVGWFYWSVGTQIILCNPICIGLYAYASWSFFKDRIPYEEQLLLKFYKGEYLQYAKNTLLGIPYINSPIDKLEQ